MRVQADHHGLGDLAGPARPHAGDRLEVARGERLEELTLARRRDARDHRTGGDVGQGVVLDDLGPGLLLDPRLRPRRRGLGGVPPAGGRRVALRLGVDERRCRPVGVDVPGRGQRRHDAPAQIGVHLEAGQAQLGGVAIE